MAYIDRAYIRGTGCTMKIAVGVDCPLIAGALPAWVKTDRFEIQATIPRTAPHGVSGGSSSTTWSGRATTELVRHQLIRLSLRAELASPVRGRCASAFRGEIMKAIALDLPTFGFIVVTRGLLGLGVGLLVSSRFSPSRRRRIGAALVGLGAATTVPALLAVRRGVRRGPLDGPVGQDLRLVGATRYPRRGDDDMA